MLGHLKWFFFAIKLIFQGKTITTHVFGFSISLLVHERQRLAPRQSWQDGRRRSTTSFRLRMSHSIACIRTFTMSSSVSAVRRPAATLRTTSFHSSHSSGVPEQASPPALPLPCRIQRRPIIPAEDERCRNGGPDKTRSGGHSHNLQNGNNVAHLESRQFSTKIKAPRNSSKIRCSFAKYTPA